MERETDTKESESDEGVPVADEVIPSRLQTGQKERVSLSRTGAERRRDRATAAVETLRERTFVQRLSLAGVWFTSWFAGGNDSDSAVGRDLVTADLDT